jgi:hypothetical protein
MSKFKLLRKPVELSNRALSQLPRGNCIRGKANERPARYPLLTVIR